ncbi:hypothetical protein GOP47_0004415 [Adiantum capillus-veneris]|uniref:Major facilitator superfamily (MFS) profile domain-containing protein n=1 Tax=Adiantum capillus-veneris TaxID=13818 RepID=A0A9D4ZPJ5_ADICA|nr:hypothetical protein GOP47_0004415 [Adiantum capillus-veneris]
MAGSFAIGPARAAQYEGRATVFVVLTCLLAALGGALFGYDIGISGGVTSMDDFLVKFFPDVYAKKHAEESNDSHYCKYDNQKLAAFTSSLYIAGLISTFGASYTTRAYGRRITILIAGASFLIGAGLDAGAADIYMLIVGRLMLGVGVGFGNQAVPLYLSEMAPPQWRGGLNMTFQLATTLGIFFANLVNYGTQHIRGWGWRLSLGLAAVPAFIMFMGGLFVYETPNSLIERGQSEKGKLVLTKIRGTDNVQAEFTDLMEASQVARTVTHPFANLLRKRNRPQLVMAFCLPIFQILTGINSILFYAPVIFQALGFGSNASLYSSVFTGGVMVLGSIITIVTVDRFGRRLLLITGGVVMSVCQVIIAILLAKFYSGDEALSKGLSIIVTLLICFFVLGFATSWGGLGWVVPSEIFPLEIRSAGQSVVVSVNLLFTFAIAQAFLSMLCGLKYGIFLFFAFWETFMTIFVYFLLPETKDVPLEEMIYVWKAHWFWGKFVAADHADSEKV